MIDWNKHNETDIEWEREQMQAKSSQVKVAVLDEHKEWERKVISGKVDLMQPRHGLSTYSLETPIVNQIIKVRQRQAPCATRAHCLGCVLVNDRQCQRMRQLARRVER